jgi:uncharacterized SAM-binding protein YcdF (DUF218 family)
MTDIDSAAQKIWNYMLLHQPLKKCEAIFILGSRDERAAEYGAKLFLEGYGDWLIISGGSAHHGDLLEVHWGASSEAEHFADIAANLGVPRDRMILETKAENTGQNILFTHALLGRKRLSFESLLLVQKPYMERRTYATFKKQWPGESIDIVVSSPPITYDNYFDEKNPKEDILNVMVGDLQRIIEYPKLGFQIAQDVPEDVLVAWKFLVDAGYTKHLMR